MNVDPSELADLFRQADVGWHIDRDPSKQKELLVQFEAEARSVSLELTSKLGRRVDVVEEVLEDPSAFKPFVQTFVMPMTAPIRAMVYCVLRGARVLSIDYKYVVKSTSQLRVTVELGPNQPIEFSSSEIWDAEVLHHFGFARLSGRPFIDGYFAFRKG